MHEDIIQEIKNYAQNTVGYNEAFNKNSFMVGVSVATSKAIEIYEKKIQQLEAYNWKGKYEAVKDDITSLTAILDKYSPKDI